MIKVFKLIDNQWEEIDNILQGLTFTEVLDDTLDTGLVQYDSYSDELMPVFTPIKVEHYHSPNDYKKIASSNLTITKQNNGLFQCSAGEYYNVLGSVNLGDIIYLDKQTNQVDKGVYKVHSAQGLNVYLENIDEFFLSAEERITVVTKANPITYRHQLIVVEPTKYLEKIIVNNLCLTNKNDTLKQQLDKALINCMLLEVSESPIFSVSSELNAFLEQTPGEDFFFDKANLREILDEMLSVVNARVYIEKITDFDNIYIKYVDMNEVKKTIEFEKMVSIERSNNVEMYAGSIEAHGANSVIPNTVFQDWTSFKTSEPTLNDNNMSLATGFPIERIIKLEVLCHFRVNDGTATPSIEEYYNFPIDLTEAVFDTDGFALLPNNYNGTFDPGMGYADYGPRLSFGKNNVLIYTRNAQSIRGGNDTEWQMFSAKPIRVAIEAAIDRACIRYIVPGSENLNRGRNWNIQLVNNVIDTLVRIEYIPYIDTLTRISKPGMYDNQRARLSLPDNQSEKNISSTRHGLNLLGKITRLGNDDYAVDDLVSNITEIKNIGERTADNYIIYKKEISYFNEHAKVRYNLSKNYNNLNEKIGINREKRIYDIPLTGFKNEVLIKSYILVGFSILTSSGLLSNAAIRSFIGRTSVCVNKFIFHTKENGLILGLDSGYDGFEIGTANYSMGNVMHYVSQCLDNYSVGHSIGGRIIGGRKVLYNPYCNVNTGEFDSFTFYLANERVIDESIGIVQQNKKMPQTKTSYYYSSLRLGNGEYKYFKDAHQQMKFNIAIEVLPASNAFNSIIIGQRLSEHNGLIKKGVTTFDNAIIYVSNERYELSEIFKTKGTILTNAIVERATSSQNAIRINYAPSIPTVYSSYAIGDNEGNLYIAVNDINKLKDWIYFSSSNILK